MATGISTDEILRMTLQDTLLRIREREKEVNEQIALLVSTSNEQIKALADTQREIINVTNTKDQEIMRLQLKVQEQELKLQQLQKNIRVYRNDADNWKHLYLTLLKDRASPPLLRIKVGGAENPRLINSQIGDEIVIKMEE